MRRLALFLVVLICLFFVPSALALAVPNKSDEFYVQDLANVIDAEAESEFIARSQALAAQDGTQIVLLTIPSLEGDSLEEFSLKTARDWSIGSAEKNNGVLILLVMDSHDIRIEVGYGLEGVLPDGLTGRLQREYLISRLKEGDYSGGVLALQQALIDTINGKEVWTEEIKNQSENDDWIFSVTIFAVVISFYLASQKNWWRKCPKCQKRQWQKKWKNVGLTQRRVLTTCKKCGYTKKGPLMSITSGSSGFGGGSFGGGSSGGSSGGGGSFGGGGSSGKW
ncbi:MAG: TPM domain-containing protein [bacterium]|nr:TPM domain-containing protein [bacterium]